MLPRVIVGYSYVLFSKIKELILVRINRDIFLLQKLFSFMHMWQLVNYFVWMKG
jgi:hypothetical protein